MHDPSSLREQTRRCRALSKIAVEPEVIEQLRVWAVELAEEADRVEWAGCSGTESHRSVRQRRREPIARLGWRRSARRRLQ